MLLIVFIVAMRLNYLLYSLASFGRFESIGSMHSRIHHWHGMATLWKWLAYIRKNRSWSRQQQLVNVHADLHILIYQFVCRKRNASREKRDRKDRKKVSSIWGMKKVWQSEMTEAKMMYNVPHRNCRIYCHLCSLCLWPFIYTWSWSWMEKSQLNW